MLDLPQYLNSIVSPFFFFAFFAFFLFLAGNSSAIAATC